MNRLTPRSIKICWVLAFCLVLGSLGLAQAEDVPDHLREVLENRFPGAVIHEIEKETWKDQKVTEVELTAQDGIKYEVYVSKDGKIVKIEEED